MLFTQRQNEKKPTVLLRTASLLSKSGRHDSNVRPPAPKAGALARLSYAPIHIGETPTPENRYVGKDASVISSITEERVR